MEPDEWQDRWRKTYQQAGVMLERAGLGAFAGAFGLAFRPLAPLVAQMIWVAQPASGLFGYGDAFQALALLLEAPPVAEAGDECQL
ncbi:MAG: hypothetical protein IT326_03540 [Anaerolineae bacterium]|nr:hypothetical protein [Anaerolineae bacterium]